VFLVDTSVWIDLFRPGGRNILHKVADFDELVTCLPVMQEVLQGFRDEAAFRKAKGAMTSMPIVEAPLSDAVYYEAIDLYRAARRAGITIRSSTDRLIAACALRHDLTVLHRDRDYTALAKICPLDARELGTRG
jgi:predicted nucleic acid-binding protein